MALACFCGVLVSVQSSYAGYAIAIALSECGFLFIMPFLIGFGSWFDASGKVAALAGGLALTASALSPIVGGCDRRSLVRQGNRLGLYNSCCSGDHCLFAHRVGREKTQTQRAYWPDGEYPPGAEYLRIIAERNSKLRRTLRFPEKHSRLAPDFRSLCDFIEEPASIPRFVAQTYPSLSAWLTSARLPFTTT